MPRTETYMIVYVSSGTFFLMGEIGKDQLILSFFKLIDYFLRVF